MILMRAESDLKNQIFSLYQEEGSWLSILKLSKQEFKSQSLKHKEGLNMIYTFSCDTHTCYHVTSKSPS